MLLLLFNMQDKGDARWVFGHHLFGEPDCEVHTFNNDGLVA